MATYPLDEACLPLSMAVPAPVFVSTEISFMLRDTGVVDIVLQRWRWLRVPGTNVFGGHKVRTNDGAAAGSSSAYSCPAGAPRGPRAAPTRAVVVGERGVADVRRELVGQREKMPFQFRKRQLRTHRHAVADHGPGRGGEIDGDITGGVLDVRGADAPLLRDGQLSTSVPVGISYASK